MPPSINEGSRVGGRGRQFALAFPQEGLSLALGILPDRTVALWDAASGETTARYNFHAHGVAISGDGTVVTAADEKLFITHLATAQSHELATPLGYVLSQAIGDDGTVLVTGHQLGKVGMWDTVTGRLTATYTGRSSEDVVDVAISAASRSIVSVSSGGQVEV